MILKLIKFLKSPPTHWQWYKGFFQITVFRYLVTWFAIVPFLARLFFDIPTSFKIDILHTNIEYSFNLSLPFNWQLLWFSSLCFVIAFGLYTIICPSFVKKYNSFSDYLSMMHSPRWIIWESRNIFVKNMDKEKFIERILTKKYVEEIPLDKFDQIKTDFNLKRKKESEEFKDYGVIIEEKQTKLYFIHDSKAFGLGLPILNQNSEDKEKTDLVEKELFWEVFGRYSASFPIIRLIILILLSISAFLFSIVLVQNIISGLRYLIL